LLLCASLLATLIAQPLAELESSPQRTVLLLRDGGGALVVFRYDVRLEAGAREISWRPDLPGLKREEARLSVSPEDAAQVGGAVLDPTRVRWSLSVPRDCAGAFSVTTPLADFAWSVQAEGSLTPDGLLWQPFLTLELKGSARLALDDVVLEAVPADEEPVSLGPIEIEGDRRLTLPVGRRYEVGAREVQRYQAAWGQVRRILLLDPGQAAATLGQWKVSQVLVAQGDARPVTAPLTLSPERGAELELGRSAQAVVRRGLMDERRENLDFDRFGRVQGHDTVEEILVEALNPTDHEVPLEIVEDLPSTWEIKLQPAPDTSWTDRAVLRLMLAPGERAVHQYLVIKHSGTRVPK